MPGHGMQPRCLAAQSAASAASIRSSGGWASFGLLRGDPDADGDGLVKARGMGHREGRDRRAHRLADLHRADCVGIRGRQNSSSP